VKKYPADWPSDGPIELAVHDLPHASSTTEWWYVNGHCFAKDERQFAFFAAFFSKVTGYHPKTREPLYAHSLTWSICDLDAKKSYSVSRVDQRAPEEGLRRVKGGFGSRDPRIDRAIREILERGVVPAPDRVFDGRVTVGLKHMALEFASDSLIKNADNSYTLKLFDSVKALGCELRFVPKRPPIRHGDNGVVRGPYDEQMFYYFIPRCELSGNITLHGATFELERGQGWYDHEFGVGDVYDIDLEAEEKLEPVERQRIMTERRTRFDAGTVGWNWISAQLDDGTELSVYPEQYVYLQKSAGDHAITIGPNGERQVYEEFSLTELEHWQSTITFVEYPIHWRLQIPKAGIDLDVRSVVEDQEVVTLIAKNSFYEGRVNVRGTRAGHPVSGVGFVERTAFGISEDLDSFFQQVGKVVRRSVDTVMPRKLTQADAIELIASKGKEHYLEGVDLDQYARAHLAPLREIVDRGGKGWRSYAMNTCIDVVGGDSRDFVKWIALPELMQTGSLIVDDVQDKSTVRRGGPAAHLMFGEGQAINSGTAAYFIGTGRLKHNQLSDSTQVKLYELYLDVMRAGHAGQALDLDGFEDVMTETVKTGKSALLESRVLAVHRLKTAAPASGLARMGAIAGGGTPEQVEGLGIFFENLGVAFQIVDDVLNVRGYREHWKSVAEDVVQGKITLPVAVAMGRLNASDRQWLCDTLRSKPTDPEVIDRAVNLLESSGALQQCADQATALIESGWAKLDPLVPESLHKMMLRAFGWYVLDRHY
jgi:geranylgeranyl pyrophosphate synthase/predicted secreted hydrolase